jgi:hypothetical protein
MNTFANTQSASRRALRSKARKLGTPRGSIGAFAVLAIVAASAASAGAFGTFTNTATVAQSPLTAGTVELTLGDNAGTGENTLTVGAGNMAAGDDVQRVVDIYNSGTLDLSELDIAASATGDSVMYDGSSSALQIDVEACSAAWTEHGDGSTTPYTYTCDSPATESTAFSSSAAPVSTTALTNVDLTSGGVNHLRVTATLPSGDDEATYGGKSATLTYTFTATQRTATDQ